MSPVRMQMFNLDTHVTNAFGAKLPLIASKQAITIGRVCFWRQTCAACDNKFAFDNA